MSVDVQVASPDLEALVGALDHFVEDQLPFALSVAMNRSAREAVTGIRENLDRTFDLRSRSLAKTFGPKGRMGDTSKGWSNKKQWPNISVNIHSLAHAMALQEEGGVKPFRSSEVWIGTSHVPRSATTGKKPAKYQPSRIKKKLEADRQRGPTRIFQRGTVVYERERATGEVLPLYIRRPRAHVDPALGAVENVTELYQSRLGVHFQAAMAIAVRTRR